VKVQVIAMEELSVSLTK